MKKSLWGIVVGQPKPTLINPDINNIGKWLQGYNLNNNNLCLFKIKKDAEHLVNIYNNDERCYWNYEVKRYKF